RTIRTEDITLPADYVPTSADETIQKLQFIKDTSIDKLIATLQDGDKLKGTSALSELVDRVCHLIEHASKTTGAGTEDQLFIVFDLEPMKTTLNLLRESIRQNTATGAPIWTDELETHHESRTHKAELLALIAAAKENAILTNNKELEK
ncbi:MAG: hypothetical protein GY762_01605, partial [Proteobacteria bacterium]|nr:hypothetical protein [Pseudomonadota bacterium]